MDIPIDSQHDTCSNFGQFCKEPNTIELEAITSQIYMENGEIKQDEHVNKNVVEIQQNLVNDGPSDKSVCDLKDQFKSKQTTQIVNRFAITTVTENNHSKKKVSFNGSLTEEIDIDFRELGFNRWNGVPKLPKDEVLSEYRSICNQYHVDIEVDVVNQLSVMQNNCDFSVTLNLLDTRITSDKLEIYERIFQLVNFHKLFINVDLLENEAVIEIFHMIEYYNSVKELILYGNYLHDSDLWASIAVAASNKENDLENISLHELKISDNGLMLMFDSINENPQIEILRFNGCQLNFTPTFSIATPLKNNRYLKELHLCNVELYYKETTILALFIRDNYSLKVLNLSNNKIGDRGFKVLVKALVEQTHDDIGIAVFLAVNNRLTRAISSSVQIIMDQCPLLQALNVGCNNLTDEFLTEIKDSLAVSQSIQALGLQSTLLTHDGVIQLMDVCQKNRVLQHINLKGNRALQHDALHTLAIHLPHTNLHQIDLDDANRFCTDTNQYIEILNNIRKLLLVKVMNEPPSVNSYSAYGPDLSLSCDVDYMPRSTWKIPRNKGRFEIVSVPETNFTSSITPVNSNTSIPNEISPKEILNWSPAYSSCSQKTNWSNVKALENIESQNQVDVEIKKSENVVSNDTTTFRRNLNFENNNNRPIDKDVSEATTESVERDLGVNTSKNGGTNNDFKSKTQREIIHLKENKQSNELEDVFNKCDSSVILIGPTVKELVNISNNDASLELDLDTTAFESIISTELDIFNSGKCSVNNDTFPESTNTSSYPDVKLISDEFYSTFN